MSAIWLFSTAKCLH